MIESHQPLLDIDMITVQDALESGDIAVIVCYSHDKPQIRNLPRPVTPVPNQQARRGTRNGRRTRTGVYIERKGN